MKSCRRNRSLPDRQRVDPHRIVARQLSRHDILRTGDGCEDVDKGMKKITGVHRIGRKGQSPYHRRLCLGPIRYVVEASGVAGYSVLVCGQELFKRGNLRAKEVQLTGRPIGVHRGSSYMVVTYGHMKGGLEWMHDQPDPEYCSPACARHLPVRSSDSMPGRDMAIWFMLPEKEGLSSCFKGQSRRAYFQQDCLSME